MAADQHSSGAPWRNFYGRFKGKTLRPGQEEALESDLAQLSPGPVSWTENPDRTALDLTQMFNASAVWLEIGFGGGEHLVHQAVQNPETGLIGCEPYINGVAMLLQKIRRAEAQNIRIYPGDARHLFDVLPPASISKAFLLYPDPWPKRRHHRRRFVTPEHLAPLARVLKPRGRVSRGDGYCRLCAPNSFGSAQTGLCLSEPRSQRPQPGLVGLDFNPL